MGLAISLLAVGLALVVAEVFFPSLGMLSLLAGASIIGALLAAFGEGAEFGVRFTIVTAVLLPTTILLGLKFFPRSPMGKYMVAPGLSFEAQAATDERDRELVGQVGTVKTALRPAGHALIAGRRVDVVSRGESIEAGARVLVCADTGNRVVVTRAPEDQNPVSPEQQGSPTPATPESPPGEEAPA